MVRGYVHRISSKGKDNIAVGAISDVKITISDIAFS